MVEYYRVKMDKDESYFIDPEGNRLDDKVVGNLIWRLKMTAERRSYVYVGCNRSNDPLYKIGFSSDPVRRAKELNIKLVLCIKTYAYGDLSARDLEGAIHKLYKTIGFHETGEWFNLEPIDVEILKCLLVVFRDDTDISWISQMRKSNITALTETIEDIRQGYDWGDPSVLDGILEVAEDKGIESALYSAYIFHALAYEYNKLGHKEWKRAYLLAESCKTQFLEWMSTTTDYSQVAGDKWSLRKAIA